MGSNIRSLSRRGFLKKTALAPALAPLVGTVRARGARERPLPSERLTMGCIGMGGMGNGDMGAFMGNVDVQVVAVCDVDGQRLESARERVDASYAEKKRSGAFRGCAAYKDFRELLAREDIEAVMIATPDHWHAIISIAALKSGKDVYCEKPLSLTIEEGRAMADAVRRYRRVFQTGSQQRSDGRFRFACELALNGRLGEVHTIRTGFGGAPATGTRVPQDPPSHLDYDFWLGQAPWEPYTPDRCHFNFRWILDYSGGMMTDWGAHHNDIAQWGNGTSTSGPVLVQGKGEFPRDGLYNTATQFHVEYTYAKGSRVICDSGQPQGVRFEGSEGWVHVKRGDIWAEPKSVLSSVIGPQEIHLYESHNHHRNFLDCVRSRKDPVAPCEVAHRSATVCHLGNIAMLLGRELRWDPVRERFVEDDEANRMVSRPQRAPWTL